MAGMQPRGSTASNKTGLNNTGQTNTAATLSGSQGSPPPDEVALLHVSQPLDHCRCIEACMRLRDGLAPGLQAAGGGSHQYLSLMLEPTAPKPEGAVFRALTKPEV